ncbi:alcohol dehydrogenase catalytic domain-containing protein [Actinomadura kijaniata]|uniref:alcohol dehydrogenase catalytic domain-containing protein n=1 Tax=Actinomadura kijaniata TaxID=46161 RepID=UPI000837539B|nr:alcohol dehydrogenase catalytic domain-containing protein [Actinomadura kijaniata]
MKAWSVRSPGPIATGPVVPVGRDVPDPGPGELLVRVRACGVCRTDLHVAEGDLPVHLPGVTPGHEVVGEVAAARELALGLGAAWAGGSLDEGPGALDAAIVFAPAGALVPAALERLDRGGTLAIAGIHLTDVPALNYRRHLFQERQIRSVTANTRADAREFLRLAGRLPLRIATVPYGLDEADRALTDLAEGRVNGAAVLLT